MLIYRCDGKGCNVTSENRDDFVRISFGPNFRGELADHLSERLLCKGCANRLAIMLLNETVAPVDEEAVNNDLITEPEDTYTDEELYDYARAYAEFMFGKATKDTIEKKYGVGMNIIANKFDLFSDKYYSLLKCVCDFVESGSGSVGEISNLTSVPADCVFQILEGNIAKNFNTDDLPSPYPVIESKRLLMAYIEMKCTRCNQSVVVRKYNVPIQSLRDVPLKVVNKADCIMKNVRDAHAAGESVDQLYTHYSLPKSLIDKILSPKKLSDTASNIAKHGGPICKGIRIITPSGVRPESLINHMCNMW